MLDHISFEDDPASFLVLLQVDFQISFNNHFANVLQWFLLKKGNHLFVFGIYKLLVHIVKEVNTVEQIV